MQNLIPQDLIKRAELFNEILDIVNTFDDKKHPPRDHEMTSITADSPAYPPTIVIVNQRILCNGTTVDLSRRPAVLQIVRLFLKSGVQPLSRDDISIGLYGHLDDERITRRYRESAIANVLKAISRARNFLTAHFSEVGVELDWLVYDAMARAWHLYRPR